MSSNLIVKITVAVLALAALMLGVTKCSRDAAVEATAGAVPVVGGDAMDQDTRTALGLEADTPEDTVQTLITNVREQNRRMEALESDNAELRSENQQLLRMEDSLWSRMQNELSNQSNLLRDTNRRDIDDARSQISQLVDRARLQSRGGEQSAPPTTNYGLADETGTVWLRPLEAGGVTGLPGSSVLANLPWQSQAPGGQTSGPRTALQGQSLESTVTPAYTIAKNSTLVGATAFTALIGRVPVGQNVVDPYSFKVLIGKDNLIANGHEIPEVAYAVASGKAIGDWTLSCVSGDVFSMTFVFEDGRIVTLPTPENIADGQTVTRDVKIGELSDAFGNPCVVGDKISNAGKYLAQRVAAVAAGAAAQAAAAAETTTTVDSIGGIGVGGTTIVSGDKGKFVLDQTLAGAAAEAAQWIRDRQALEFDAVYAPPGQRVAIHITEELRIDYDELARMTHYPGFLLGAQHRELD